MAYPVDKARLHQGDIKDMANYEPPILTKIGTVAELTQGDAQGMVHDNRGWIRPRHGGPGPSGPGGRHHHHAFGS